MVTDPPSPEQLAAVLKRLDEVEAEALRLREQITRAMRVRRASDRPVAGNPTGRTTSHRKR